MNADECLELVMMDGMHGIGGFVFVVSSVIRARAGRPYSCTVPVRHYCIEFTSHATAARARAREPASIVEVAPT
jgi:hypothetical protein